jgi:RNA polymerase sigma-70 factor (ECF subfamily)
MRAAPSVDCAPPPDAADGAGADDRLVARFRAGDREAFDALVRRHQAALVRFVRRNAGDDAEDVAQQAFVRAFEQLDGFAGRSAFRTWLFRIGLNLALNQARGRRRQPLPPPVSIATTEAVPAAALRALVGALPHKQRLALELRLFDELSFREVGEVLGTSESAAKANFHHALKRLRKQWTSGDEP